MPLTKKETDYLITAIRSLGNQSKPETTPAPRAAATPTRSENGPAPSTPPSDWKAPEGWDERLYQAFKARIIDDCRFDPLLLRLLQAQPEIEIMVEPRVVTLEGSSLRGRVARLMASGWFKDGRALRAVRTELARTGSDPGGGGTLGDTLSAFVRDGFLTREDDGYKLAPGVKVTEREVKVT